MKVAKKDLVEGLKMVKGFKNGKSYPELGKVLIDGPSQKIIATDMQTRGEVAISLTDYKQKIVGEKPAVVHPDEDLTTDLKSLKVGQLVDLCEYAGIDLGEKAKKADMVESIFNASEAAAQTEEKLPPPETEVDERFLVDPDHLLKIVNSENSGDVIDLHVEEFEQKSDFLTEGVNATALAIGEHFQRIPLTDIKEFPDAREFTGTQVATIKGDDLRSLTDACNYKDDASPHQTVVMFDAKEKNLVSTNGNRLHMLKHQINLKQNITLPAGALGTLAKVAKDKDVTMKIDKNGSRAQFTYGKLTVLTKDEDVNFPDYMGFMNGTKTVHSIEIDNDVFKDVVKQVGLISEVADFTLNGVMNVEAANDDKGEYRRFDVPFLKGKVDPEMTVRLNTGYVADALKHVGKKVTLKLSDDSMKPVFFEGGNLKAAIMGINS